MIQILAVVGLDPVAPDAERRGPAGARPRGTAAPIHDRSGSRHASARSRSASSGASSGVAACLRGRDRARRAAADLSHDARARHLALAVRPARSRASRRRRPDGGGASGRARAADRGRRSRAARGSLVLVVLGAGVYVVACLWRAPEVTGEIRGVIGRSVEAALRSSPRTAVSSEPGSSAVV